MSNPHVNGTTQRGDAAASSQRMECRICWTVYDPAIGDEVWQIAPGTPFSELPAYWSCPNCAAEKSGFLVQGG
jgi:rubredoxin